MPRFSKKKTPISPEHLIGGIIKKVKKEQVIKKQRESESEREKKRDVDKIVVGQKAVKSL